MSDAHLHILDNGVRILLDPMPHLMTSSVGVWVQAGARLEGPNENGIAHLLEHLVFKGAGTRDARTLVEEAEGRGIYLNAATGYERTGFFARCLKDHTDFALQLCTDLVLHPQLNADDLELEKNVILQEIGEAFDDAEDRCGVVHQMAAFPGHALGRPILGDEASLKAITKSDIDAFRARTYAPRHMVIAASGAIDPDRIIEQIEGDFGGLKDFAPAPTPPLGLKNEANGRVRSEVRDSEQVHLMMSIPGPIATSDTAISARVLCEILGGGMASRLFQDLRETRGLVYNVEAFCDFYKDAGRLCISAACQAKAAQDVATRTAHHLMAMAEQGPSSQEVQRAQNILEASIMMAAESPAARCEGGAAQVFLHGRPLSLAEVSARVRSATQASVQAAARKAVEGAQSGGVAASAVGPKAGLAGADAFGGAFGVVCVL